MAKKRNKDIMEERGGFVRNRPPKVKKFKIKEKRRK